MADRDLIKLIVEKDRDAFETLYHRRQKPIFNYLVRLIHEHAVAEELLQEVFFVVWKNARYFRSESRVNTWMFRIAHNQAVDWLRSRKPESLLLDEQLAANEITLEEISIHAWESAEIRLALDNLPPNQRAVVELYFVNDLTQKEICDVMASPLGTVKSRLRLALKNLRWDLTRQGLAGRE